MRTLAGLVVVAAMASGCTAGHGTSPARESVRAEPPGCGLVPSRQVVGLLGASVAVAVRGSADDLRRRHRTLVCTNTVPRHPERFVTVRARYHPAPLQLPSRACAQGWVYAGTPGKFAPACQETRHGHGRTDLLVRWQPYVMEVTIGRSDRGWGGDPEVALAMSRVLARRLGVREAATSR
jgi:hypothetical protein